MTNQEIIKGLQAVNEHIGKHFNEGGAWMAEFIDNAIKALESQRWIPVSERLPKTDEDVLVCNSQGTMEVCYYHIDDTFYPTEYADLNETGWYSENDDVLYFEPIAWMPFEPYKAESEE